MPVPWSPGAGLSGGSEPTRAWILGRCSGPPASSPCSSQSLSCIVSGREGSSMRRMSHRDQSPPRPRESAGRDSWACPQPEAFWKCSVPPVTDEEAKALYQGLTPSPLPGPGEPASRDHSASHLKTWPGQLLIQGRLCRQAAGERQRLGGGECSHLLFLSLGVFPDLPYDNYPFFSPYVTHPSPHADKYSQINM